MTDINPSIWGPSGWIFLENVAKGFPKNPTIIEKHNYKVFFTSLTNILPCSTCRQNYKKHLRNYPLKDYLKNSNTLLKWVNLIKTKTKEKIKQQIKAQKSSLLNSTNERIERIQNRKISRSNGCKRCGRNKS